MRKFDRSVALAAVFAVAGMASVGSAQVTIDGTRDAGYGTPLATQTVQTQFGDNQSELDAMYSNINAGKMNLFFAGNLESNFNKLVVFFDSKAGGQNTILASSPIQDNYAGIKFDAGFSPDYSMIINRGGGNLYVDFSELPTAGGGFGGYAGRIVVPDGIPANQQIGSGFLIEGNAGMPAIEIGYNDSNVDGVAGGTDAADQAAANAVTTGTEFSLDLSSLGITGNFKVMAFINGSSHDFASNQFLPGLPAPQGNLGNNGTGGLSNVDLTAFAGDQFVEIPYTAAVNQWALSTGGSWNAPASWSLGVVPNGPTAQAILSGGAGSGTRVVTLNNDITIQSLTFNNATASYNVSSPGTLTVSGSPLLPALSVVAGSHSISAPVTFANTTRVEVAAGTSLALTGTVTAAGKDVFVNGGGTFAMPATAMNSITVNGGTAKLTGTGPSTVRGVTVDTGAVLDLTGSSLIVDYDDTFSPLAAIKTAIAENRLTSSTITAPNTAFGYLDSAFDPALTSYDGVPLDANALVIRKTLKGDANLSKVVEFQDLVALAQNYNGTGKEWYQGDFDGDGDVDFQDLVPLAQNYNGSLLDGGQLAALGDGFAADWALAQSLVPEPTSLTALVAVGAIFKRRRRA